MRAGQLVESISIATGFGFDTQSGDIYMTYIGYQLSLLSRKVSTKITLVTEQYLVGMSFYSMTFIYVMTTS